VSVITRRLWLIGGAAFVAVVAGLSLLVLAHRVRARDHVPDSVTIMSERELSVGAGCPSTQPRVAVVEKTESVGLMARYKATDLKCLATVVVRLAQPLGSRQLVYSKEPARLLFVDFDKRCLTAPHGQRCDGVATGSQS
jgi:hypothetical protein